MASLVQQFADTITLLDWQVIHHDGVKDYRGGGWHNHAQLRLQPIDRSGSIHSRRHAAHKGRERQLGFRQIRVERIRIASRALVDFGRTVERRLSFGNSVFETDRRLRIAPGTPARLVPVMVPP